MREDRIVNFHSLYFQILSNNCVHLVIVPVQSRSKSFASDDLTVIVVNLKIIRSIHPSDIYWNLFQILLTFIIPNDTGFIKRLFKLQRIIFVFFIEKINNLIAVMRKRHRRFFTLTGITWFYKKANERNFKSLYINFIRVFLAISNWHIIVRLNPHILEGRKSGIKRLSDSEIETLRFIAIIIVIIWASPPDRDLANIWFERLLA